jgi:general secretion pathway protein L
VIAPASAVRQFLIKAWSWWIGEMKDLMPPGLLARVHARRGQLVIHPTSAGLAASVAYRGRSVDIGVIEDSSTLDRQLAQARKLLGWRRLAIVLRPGSDQLLIGKITLPAAAKENLREVVGFEMDRFTPFTAEEVYYGCKPAGKPAQSGRIDVTVALTPRPVVDQAIDRLKRLGILIDAVEIPSAYGPDVAGLNLLPPAMRPQPWRIHNWVLAVLLTVTAVMVATSIAVPLERASVLADSLSRAAIRQRKLAQDADELQKKIDALRTERMIAAGAAGNPPTVTEIMDEVARILPDDSWLSRLRWDGQQLELSGFSRDSTSLVALIGASPLLSGVAFAAPVTIDPTVGRERFVLTARIETAGVPEGENIIP